MGGGQRVQLRIADVVQDGDRVGDGVGVDRRGAGFDDMPEAGEHGTCLLDGDDDLGVRGRPWKR